MDYREPAARGPEDGRGRYPVRSPEDDGPRSLANNLRNHLVRYMADDVRNCVPGDSPHDSGRNPPRNWPVYCLQSTVYCLLLRRPRTKASGLWLPR